MWSCMFFFSYDRFSRNGTVGVRVKEGLCAAIDETVDHFGQTAICSP